LLLALFVQATFAVEQRILPAGAGAGMTKDVEDHKDGL
jgi:hypothetical protein